MYVSIPHYLKHQFCKGQSRKMVISLLGGKGRNCILEKAQFIFFFFFFFAKTIYNIISNNANSTKYVKTNPFRISVSLHEKVSSIFFLHIQTH